MFTNCRAGSRRTATNQVHAVMVAAWCDPAAAPGCAMHPCMLVRSCCCSRLCHAVTHPPQPWYGLCCSPLQRLLTTMFGSAERSRLWLLLLALLLGLVGCSGRCCDLPCVDAGFRWPALQGASGSWHGRDRHLCAGVGACQGGSHSHWGQLIQGARLLG